MHFDFFEKIEFPGQEFVRIIMSGISSLHIPVLLRRGRRLRNWSVQDE